MSDSSREDAPVHGRIAAHILNFHHHWTETLRQLPSDFDAIERHCRRLFGIWERTGWIKYQAGEPLTGEDLLFSREWERFHAAVSSALLMVRQELERHTKD